MTSQEKVLITGGAGFIGTSLAENLSATCQVVLFDRRFDRMPYQFSPCRTHPNVRAVAGDVQDYSSLESYVKDATVVIHLAAVVGVDRVRQNARETINVNFLGTSNALRAAEGNGGLRRFVYFSTSEIFGTNSFRAKEGTSASIGPVTEARWSYSIAKLAGEHLAKAYHRELGLPTVIVRPFNIFGPKRIGDHAMLRFILSALRNENLEVHGDGSQIRSWCYIDDLCEGVMQILTNDAAVGQDFNLGSSKNTLTIYALAQKVIALTGSRSKVVFTHKEFADIDIRVPRLDKAREILQYEPQYELDDALKKTIAWCRENLGQLEDLHG